MSNGSAPRPASGSKIVSPQGTRAVLDGIKPNASSTIPDVGPKPPWLRVRLPNGAKYREVMDIVTSHKLSTVCAESKCPNIAECWGGGTATVMLYLPNNKEVPDPWYGGQSGFTDVYHLLNDHTSHIFETIAKAHGKSAL